MKSVGILTFHYTTNYGAVLQAYALKQYLTHLGYKSTIIDYRTSTEIDAMRVFRLLDYRNPINYYKYLYNKKKHEEKISSFKAFISNNLCELSTPLKRSQLPKLCNDYHALICGSDQIWNQYITEKDEAFFLDFVNKPRKVAYAASIGASAQNIEHCKIMSQHLKSFYSVGVREQESVDLLDSYGINATLCCDPTLLLDARDWRFFSQSPEMVFERFIFVYELEENNDMRAQCELMAQYYHCKVLYLKANSLKSLSDTDNIHYINYCKPEEFIWYILNSEYVLTNSFHGMLFSINFEKQFTVFLLKGDKAVNNRITDLLFRLNLTSRIADIHLDRKTEINYSAVAEIITKYRRDSRSFLYESLLN